MKESTAIAVKSILLVILTIFIFQLKDVILVILTAVVIAAAIEPPIKWLINHGIPRVISALMVYSLVAGILVGGFYTVVPHLLKDTSEFLSSVPSYIDSTASLWNPLGDDEVAVVKPGVVAMSAAQDLAQARALDNAAQASDLSLKGVVGNVDSAISNLSAGFVHSASSVFGGVLSFILIAVLSFYLAVQEDGIEKFLRVVIPSKQETYIVDLWKRVQVKIGLWMQGQLVLALVVGILVYLGLTVLGVRNALLFAVLAAALETIPLFGPIIAAIPAVAVSYNDGGASSAIVVTGLYLIIHQFENHLIYPLVVKKIVGVPPILVILSLLVGLKLAGFLGIILSVPAASMLVEFVGDMEKRRKSNA